MSNTAPKRPRARRTTAQAERDAQAERQTVAVEPAPASAESVAECNTTGCRREATTHGLCDGHWASRRGDHV